MEKFRRIVLFGRIVLLSEHLPEASSLTTRYPDCDVADVVAYVMRNINIASVRKFPLVTGFSFSLLE